MAEIDPLAFQKGFQSSQSMIDSARQNKLQDLILGQKMQEINQQNALASIIGNAQNYDASGNLKRETLPQIAQASPGQYGAFRQQIAQQDAATLATQKAKQGELLEWMKFAEPRMANVTDQNSWTAFKQQAVQVFPDMASRLPDQYDPVAVKNAQANAVPMLDRLKLLQQQGQFDQQQATTRRGQDLTAETARRGQDMTDARAREANGLQGDLKRLQLNAAQEKEQDRSQAKRAQIANAEDSLAVLDKAIGHPGRETASGVSGTLDPRNYVPGTDAKNFRVVLDQIKGQAFMQAYQNLRGGGQITEIEGKKATDAIARLDTAQSDKEFLTALNDLRSVMARGYERLAGKQYGATSAPAAGGAQKIGSKAEFDALPSGSLFVAPDGTTRRKP